MTGMSIEEVREMLDEAFEHKNAKDNNQMGLSAADKIYIQEQDAQVAQRLKLWIISTALVNVIALFAFLMPVIFYLGGIYKTSLDTVKLIERQQSTLDQRGQWMQDRERWELAIEIWAKSKGYQPPRYMMETTGDN